jgi:NADH-quinone oxidoreductase subunit E
MKAKSASRTSKAKEPAENGNNGNKVGTTMMDEARIDQIIEKYQGKADGLIQILIEIQHENHWIPQDVVSQLSRRLNVPLSTVEHVVTFHKSLSLTPEATHEIHVCNGTGCHVRGAARVVDKVQDIIGVVAGETDPTSKFALHTVTCMGCCSSGPVMVVDGKLHEKVTPATAADVLKSQG